MREDLHLQGNQLNYITIVFWASYCTLMIPACYLLTWTRVNIADIGTDLGLIYIRLRLGE
jgi:ACS family pantothenate transporter-like MFS transporter